MNNNKKEKTFKDWIILFLPRIFSTVLLIGLTIIIQMLLTIGLQQISGSFTDIIFTESINYFLLIFVVFEVAIHLLKGTIFPYVLSIARTITTMLMIIIVTNNGILSYSIHLFQDANFFVTVDLQTVIIVFFMLFLVNITKNIFQAIEFLSEREEDLISYK
jgi:hypothetical protein